MLCCGCVCGRVRACVRADQGREPGHCVWRGGQAAGRAVEGRHGRGQGAVRGHGAQGARRAVWAWCGSSSAVCVEAVVASRGPVLRDVLNGSISRTCGLVCLRVLAGQGAVPAADGRVQGGRRRRQGQRRRRGRRRRRRRRLSSAASCCLQSRFASSLHQCGDQHSLGADARGRRGSSACGAVRCGQSRRGAPLRNAASRQSTTERKKKRNGVSFPAAQAFARFAHLLSPAGPKVGPPVQRSWAPPSVLGVGAAKTSESNHPPPSSPPHHLLAPHVMHTAAPRSVQLQNQRSPQTHTPCATSSTDQEAGGKPGARSPQRRPPRVLALRRCRHHCATRRSATQPPQLVLVPPPVGVGRRLETAPVGVTRLQPLRRQHPPDLQTRTPARGHPLTANAPPGELFRPQSATCGALTSAAPARGSAARTASLRSAQKRE